MIIGRLVFWIFASEPRYIIAQREVEKSGLEKKEKGKMLFGMLYIPFCICVDYVHEGRGPLTSIGGCGGNAFIHTHHTNDSRQTINRLIDQSMHLLLRYHFLESILKMFYPYLTIHVCSQLTKFASLKWLTYRIWILFKL